jgi:hypothetical protein
MKLLVTLLVLVLSSLAASSAAGPIRVLYLRKEGTPATSSLFDTARQDGGSHRRLAHEFAMVLVKGRQPFPNAMQSANWTCTGILAHQSAMQGGAIKHLPQETLS